MVNPFIYCTAVHSHVSASRVRIGHHSVSFIVFRWRQLQGPTIHYHNQHNINAPNSNIPYPIANTLEPTHNKLPTPSPIHRGQAERLNSPTMSLDTRRQALGILNELQVTLSLLTSSQSQMSAGCCKRRHLVLLSSCRLVA